MKNKNVRLFYILEGLLALAGGIILPAYVVYFRRWDISLFEIALLAAVFEATIIIFELPTGIFADKYGRKLSCTIGYGLLAVSAVVFFRFPSLPGFLAAEIIFGLAETFVSGALEALAVESLDDKEKQASLFANRAIYRTSGLLFGMIIAGLLADKYLPYLFVPVIIIGLINCFLSLFLSGKGIGKENAGARDNSGSVSDIIFGNKFILALFAVGLLANFVYEGADQFWPVLFNEIKQVTANNFGFLTAGGLILATIALRFTRALYDKISLYISFVFVATALALTASVYLYWSSAIFGLIVYFALKELIRPALSTHLNRQFNASGRATYLSAYNLTCSVGEVAAGLLAGALVSLFGVEFIFYFSAIVALLVPVVFVLIKSHHPA